MTTKHQEDITDRLARADGSELLPKVILGSKNAMDTCLEARREILRLRAKLTEIEKQG
jgi:hypothetical protein